MIFLPRPSLNKLLWELHSDNEQEKRLNQQL